MNVLGTHLLLELRDCDPRLLDDLAHIRRQLRNAADAVGAQVVGESFHRFSPQGVTGILSIAESHISIHTWPELAYAAADIFTCGERTMPDRAADIIIAALRCQDSEITEIRRGPGGARISRRAAAAATGAVAPAGAGAPATVVPVGSPATAAPVGPPARRLTPRS